MSYIRIENISKIIHGKNILSNIELSINKGEMICIAGISGSGKSSLLKILGGLSASSLGEIYVDNENLTKFTKEKLDLYRRDYVGYVFQEFNLIEGLTVKENIILPLTIKELDKKEIEKIYKITLEQLNVGLYEDSYIDKISGGQQQRTAILRALIKQPKIILADEPTGNLDYMNAKKIVEFLREVNIKNNTTIIVVTHDPNIASYCDRIVFMEAGKIDSIIERNNLERDMFYENIVRKFENFEV